MKSLKSLMVIVIGLVLLGACAQKQTSDDFQVSTTKAKKTAEAETSEFQESNRQRSQQVYTVKKGDTCWDIGQKFGVSSAKIMETNNLKECGNIYPGDKLVIPSGGKDSIPNGDNVSFRVSPDRVVMSVDFNRPDLAGQKAYAHCRYLNHRYPEDDVIAVSEIQSDGSAVFQFKNPSVVIEDGDRHTERFWFTAGGDWILPQDSQYLYPDSRGNLAVEAQFTPHEASPVPSDWRKDVPARHGNVEDVYPEKEEWDAKEY